MVCDGLSSQMNRVSEQILVEMHVAPTNLRRSVELFVVLQNMLCRKKVAMADWICHLNPKAVAGNSCTDHFNRPPA